MASVNTPIFRVLSLLATLLLTVFLPAQAQMFSVGESVSDEIDGVTNYTSISIGLEPATFTYSNKESLALPASDFGFDATAIRLLFQSRGIDMYLGAAGGITGLDNQTYVNAGAIIYNTFILHSTDRLWITLPVQLNTDLTRSSKDGQTQEFQQSAFQFGAGPGLRAQLSNNLGLQIKAIPSYGFSVSQGSIFGGSIFSFFGKARIYLENVIGGEAVVLGYDYTLKNYDIDGDTYDYDFRGHTFSLGITF